jgi:alkylation response protein AidB-like acyl-CoA dehydrogenase
MSSATKRSAAAPGGKRDAMGFGLALLNKLAGLETVDRLGLRKPLERVVYQATKTGFRTAGAATRTFQPVQKRQQPVRLPNAGERGVFDLTPTDEQRMIQAAIRDFAANELRPAAADSDAQCSPPEKLLFKAASELGVTFAGVPETLGGAGSERSAITNVLVAEALAHGDMGLAVATLAPAAVSTSLVLWGDESQQANYLPSFVGEDVPTAALAIIEPHALFDAFSLETMARQQGGGYVLDGVKSLVPGAARAELFVIAAELEGTSRLFIVESSSNGLSIEAEPAMGLRAAATGRVRLDSVAVPARALLGTGDDYADCVRLSRLGWAALAVGTSQAVLDYVIPYVNERIAFGEPVSNRQSVAFMVANIGIELEGIRLATYRAASRAEQGKSFARETAVARRLAGEYGMQIGSNGVQLLGGHGFVKERPVERWYRDLRAVAIMEGVVLV